jgi:hypothetical protein
MNGSVRSVTVHVDQELHAIGREPRTLPHATLHRQGPVECPLLRYIGICGRISAIVWPQASLLPIEFGAGGRTGRPSTARDSTISRQRDMIGPDGVWAKHGRCVTTPRSSESVARQPPHAGHRACRVRCRRRGDHEHRRARVAGHAIEVLPRSDGNEAASSR